MRSYDMTQEDWDKLEALKCDDFAVCPFCKQQKAYLFMDTTMRRLANAMNNENFPNRFYVECGNCFARSGYDLDPYIAIENWNNRK
ncbi:MAG: Lar family restriction alleviation protein [Ruminococcus sp.]|nr:Lar family restriction alleviation protein [Ruminococcus sp.]